MKVSEFRATLEEYAGIIESAGKVEEAHALRRLSRTLKAADKKKVTDIIPAFERAACCDRPPVS